MGYRAATGRGTSRINATHVRPCTDSFLPAPFAARDGRRFELSLNRDGPLVFLFLCALRRKGTDAQRGKGGVAGSKTRGGVH